MTKLTSRLTAAQRKQLLIVCNDLLERYRYFKTIESEESIDLNKSSYEREQAELQKKLISRLERFVERLPDIEKRLIQFQYMGSEQMLDYQTYQIELGIAEGTYSKYRLSAFFKLAGTFRLEYGADPIEVPNV